jgi:hypothetical protein
MIVELHIQGAQPCSLAPIPASPDSFEFATRKKMGFLKSKKEEARKREDWLARGQGITDVPAQTGLKTVR